MSVNEVFASALLDAERAPPAGLKAWNGSDPARRFNVYRNNVMAALTEALAASFPVTQALVGVEFFRAMARIFVVGSPPVTSVLFEYGTDFPDFIADFVPAAGLPYLADVARLEYCRVESFHAADAVALDAQAFHVLQANPDSLSALRLRLHPACRLVRSKHAVFSIWAAHQGLMAIESVVLDDPEDALVFRPKHEVLTLGLPPGGAVFLGAIADRCTLAEAAARAASEDGFDLSANLRGLIDHGLVI
jgi:hypothetical protein